MANRNMENKRAIAKSAAAGMETEAKEFAKREDFGSKYIYKVEGVPKDPAVLSAVDEWADVWGNEVVTLVNNEGLLDDDVPEQKEAREKLSAAADELAKQLPNAKFMTGLVFFEGGHIELSSS